MNHEAITTTIIATTCQKMSKSGVAEIAIVNPSRGGLVRSSLRRPAEEAQTTGALFTQTLNRNRSELPRTLVVTHPAPRRAAATGTSRASSVKTPSKVC